MPPVQAGFRVEKELVVAQIQTPLIVAPAVDVVGHISDLQIAIGHEGTQGNFGLRIAGHVHFIAHRLVVAVLVGALVVLAVQPKIIGRPNAGQGVDAHPRQSAKVIAEVAVPEAPQDVCAIAHLFDQRRVGADHKVVQPALADEVGGVDGIPIDDGIFQAVIGKGIAGAVLLKVAFSAHEIGGNVQIPVARQVQFGDKLRVRLAVLVDFIRVAVVVVGAGARTSQMVGIRRIQIVPCDVILDPLGVTAVLRLRDAPPGLLRALFAAEMHQTHIAVFQSRLARNQIRRQIHRRAVDKTIALHARIAAHKRKGFVLLALEAHRARMHHHRRTATPIIARAQSQLGGSLLVRHPHLHGNGAAKSPGAHRRGAYPALNLHTV